MQPLVSICIPTYNRADCLKQTIESIINQPEFKSGEVEIVVSDNASTDNTNEVCKQYNHFDNFFYSRNDENVRDINFPIVLTKAHGKLRKLNNDTFVLNEDALKKLCALVKEYDKTRPFIFLRYEDKETKELNFHDFILDVGCWITWIASFTIWDNECAHIESDTGSCELKLWQVRKALDLAYKKDNTVVYYQTIGKSISPPKKDISYGLYQIFYCNYMKLLQPYLENGALTEEDIESIEKNLLFNFFPAWIIQFELNNTNLQYSTEENLKEAIWNHYKDKPYWNDFIKIYNRSFFKAKLIHTIKKVLGRA